MKNIEYYYLLLEIILEPTIILWLCGNIDEQDIKLVDKYKRNHEKHLVRLWLTTGWRD